MKQTNQFIRLFLMAAVAATASIALAQTQQINMRGNGVLGRYYFAHFAYLRPGGAVQVPSSFVCGDRRVEETTSLLGTARVSINSSSARLCRWEHLEFNKVRITGKGTQTFRYRDQNGRLKYDRVPGDLIMVITNDRNGRDRMECWFQPYSTTGPSAFAPRGKVLDQWVTGRAVDFHYR